MHRTETIDFAVITHGQLTLYLENGEKQVCRPGDVIVQRSTIHAWHNETDEWTRMYFVMLGKPRSESTMLDVIIGMNFVVATNPVKVGGHELREEFKPPLA